MKKELIFTLYGITLVQPHQINEWEPVITIVPEEFSKKMVSLVNSSLVILPTLSDKLERMKQFGKALEKEDDSFRSLEISI